MGKWNFDKIRNCSEIKFGTFFSIRGDDLPLGERIVIGFSSICLRVASSSSPSGIIWCDSVDDISFYRPDGTEILPLKEKVMKKFYLFSMKSGTVSVHFYSDDLKTRWVKGKEEYLMDYQEVAEWTRTNCFIEKEVEA